ncbi:uncharacterized protein LOC124190841 [Daphnia pulex]|uniref:uncharacterized protein LOC124190841 n=1 Tax=Daphnia pulex TaxID=6669 RepID=UPI001EDCDF5B|nr:uncharacterized protein LOC124190841 [Daphnia pulex]XP_046439665.1 uncharacterized protein LOC124190841 [Daphnia pulex]XP_046439666.1 uncharacterized protein LOC124190841 [Daphnia pulex]
MKHSYQLLVCVQVKSVALLWEFISTKVLNLLFRVTAAEYKTTLLTVRMQRNERAIYNQPFLQSNMMDDPTGLDFLSSVLDQMSYPNQIVSSGGRNISDATDVRDLHKYLMGGCYKTDQDALTTFPAGLLSNGTGSSSFSLVLPPSLLDEDFHYDFTNTSDSGVDFSRGGSNYIRPCGWKRYALKVKGKYPDDIWLKGKYRRADEYSSAEGEWAVSYHGTSYHNGLSIASEGFKLNKGERFLHGKGIYSTPDIEVASLYAMTVNVNGKTYKFVLQNRVNPDPVKLEKVPKTETGVGEYWISSTDDDIRPYGFCVREIISNSSAPAPAPPSSDCVLL